MNPDSSPKPLSGIRVLDFTRVLAGPFCTMMLGDMGADVIKIEHPTGGDETRQWGPPWFGTGDDALSAYFISVNRNKRSLTLNLKSAEGRDLARQLAVKSQVVIENFKVGAMAEFGLSYADLQPLNPALVYCSITGFGQNGPYHERPGYDYVVQAMSGLMSITGPADGAILAALRHSERTGEGQYIDLALLDSQLAALVNIASNTLISGQTSPRLGNEHPNIVPYQTFSAADKDFVLAVGNDRQFAALCRLIERPDLASDPRFSTNPKRLENRAELIPLLQGIFRQHPAERWVEGLLAANIPAGSINDVASALHDPQVQARGLVHHLPLDNGDVLPLVGSPAQFSATPSEIRLPPPILGQHTDEVLREVLNLDDEALTAFHASGVI